MTDPRAMLLDQRAVDDLVARAQTSPRRRLNLNLHAQLSDPVQRFLNAGEPDSYVRPHRHQAERWELFTVLRGRMDVFLYADSGAIRQRATLAAGSGCVIEIAGGTWHSFAIMAAGTVALELKPGPYVASSDKEFAAWAPDEGAADAARYLAWLTDAAIGQRWEPGS
jgi:cupin fold WbuC family metalloprotein